MQASNFLFEIFIPVTSTLVSMAARMELDLKSIKPIYSQAKTFMIEP